MKNTTYEEVDIFAHKETAEGIETEIVFVTGLLDIVILEIFYSNN